MNPIRKQFTYGNCQVVFETGEIARQADAAVMVDMEGTVVLVTVVGKKEASPDTDFFPLTVNYQEKAYAAGRIPGGFFKREGRPSEKETLTARLIDRPIRPLFPDGFTHEVQIVATVLSLNPEIDPDIPSMLGASAALMLSGMPFKGPIGAARVGYIDNRYVLNPTASELDDSWLDLVVAGTARAVLMVESEAYVLPEEVMLGAVTFGHEQMQTVITAIRELAETVGVKPWNWTPPVPDEELRQQVEAQAMAAIGAAYRIPDKQLRAQALKEARKAAVEALTRDGRYTESAVRGVFEKLEYELVRARILNEAQRIDGRDLTTIRPISIRTGVLPRTHGSALFTRGETQALVVATLGTGRDAQVIDAIEGEYKEPFMLHYNFPPFCVGEIGPMGSPKRREIGHGRLAKRGCKRSCQTRTNFPT